MWGYRPAYRRSKTQAVSIPGSLEVWVITRQTGVLLAFDQQIPESRPVPSDGMDCRMIIPTELCNFHRGLFRHNLLKKLNIVSLILGLRGGLLPKIIKWRARSQGVEALGHSPNIIRRLNLPYGVADPFEGRKIAQPKSSSLELTVELKCTNVSTICTLNPVYYANPSPRTKV